MAEGVGGGARRGGLPAMSERGRRRVAVVGGGLAGLAAALACADGGAQVTLFESRKWLGGATSSFERDGMTLDTGQHVFLRCCTAYRGFLDRIGSTANTTLQRRMDIPVLSSSGRVARLRRAGLPAPLHLAPALARYPFLTPAERLRAVRASMAMRRVDPRDQAADGRSFGSWLAEHGQSQGAVRYLWDLFGLPALNLPASEASLALAAKVFRTGLLERSDAADIGVPNVPLADLHATPAARALAGIRAEVRLGERVRAVSTSGQRVIGVATDEGEWEADAVVLAVPHDRVQPLLPAGAVADPGAFGRLGASPIVNVHVVYDRPVTGLRFAAAVDSPVQWVFDRTGPAGLDHGQYLAISLSGASAVVDDPVERFRQVFEPALEALFPLTRQAHLERFLVTRERTATFHQGPGTAALRPRSATGLRGLFLAGAWTDTGWPATMEGAVRSGLAAARAALLETERPERLPAEAMA
jgi:squalene-associated FAD-dependent desaturase